jgi:transmembrane sensor
VDELIIRILNGEASPFEEERLLRWRRESPENDAYYRDLARIWAITAPEPHVGPIPAVPSETEILHAATSLEAEREAEGDGPGQSTEAHAIGSDGDPPLGRIRDPRRSSGGRRVPWRTLGLLAASVAAVSVGLQLVVPGGPEPLAEYAAPAGRNLTVALDDGSLVRLAPGARLEVWENPAAREVSLHGRGFFAVAKNPDRPFIVGTGMGELQVLGTRFEVSEEETGVRTVVVEGRVALTNPHGRAEAPAGTLSYMGREEAPTVEEVDDVWALMDWPGGILVFQDTPLREVVREVSRHFGREIRIRDRSLEERRITAWFDEEPFPEVAEAICLVVGASCSREGGGFSIGPVKADGGTP